MEIKFTTEEQKQVCDFISCCIKDEMTRVELYYLGTEFFSYDAINDESVFEDCVIGWREYCIENNPWGAFDEKYEFKYDDSTCGEYLRKVPDNGTHRFEVIKMESGVLFQKFQ